MDPIAVIRAKLAAYPDVTINPVTDGIRIEALNADGFPVTVGWDGYEWTISAGENGMHSHRSEPKSVVDHVDFLLSDEAVLSEVCQGDELIGATTRPVRDGTPPQTGSVSDPVTGRTAKIFRNRLFPRGTLKS